MQINIPQLQSPSIPIPKCRLHLHSFQTKTMPKPQDNHPSSSTTTIHPTNPLLLTPPLKLTLNCRILNHLLSGGLPAGTITELTGESSTGKTQICLQLLLTSLLPLHLGGLDSSASLFISSSSHSPHLRRLNHLVSSFHLSSFSSSSQPLDNIYFATAQSPPDLLYLLSQADYLSTIRRVKLIIIDSIAAVFSGEFDNSASEMWKRSGLLFKIAAKLKRQAVEFGCVMVVANQVVDVVAASLENSVGGGGVELWSSGRRVAPALGLSWANCVNLRLFLSRNEEVVGKIGGELVMRTRRWVRVVFAPHLPDSVCEFVIRKGGVLGVQSTTAMSTER